MAKNKVRLESNFRKVLQASDLATAELIARATDRMQEVAAERLDRSSGRRGYNLSGSDITKEIRPKDGRISYPHWYGRFFEYGTVRITAMPFMRPGHRAGRKTIRLAPEVFDRWFKRRARVR